MSWLVCDLNITSYRKNQKNTEQQIVEDLGGIQLQEITSEGNGKAQFIICIIKYH